MFLGFTYLSLGEQHSPFSSLGERKLQGWFDVAPHAVGHAVHWGVRRAHQSRYWKKKGTMLISFRKRKPKVNDLQKKKRKKKQGSLGIHCARSAARHPPPRVPRTLLPATPLSTTFARRSFIGSWIFHNAHIRVYVLDYLYTYNVYIYTYIIYIQALCRSTAELNIR